MTASHGRSRGGGLGSPLHRPHNWSKNWFILILSVSLPPSGKYRKLGDCVITFPFFVYQFDHHLLIFILYCCVPCELISLYFCSWNKIECLFIHVFTTVINTFYKSCTTIPHAFFLPMFLSNVLETV